MPGWGSLVNASDDGSAFGGDEPTAGGGQYTSRSRGTSPDEWSTSGTVRPEGYILTGAPPPCGQGAPKTPNEFLSLTVACARKNPDATGKDVVWYDMTIRTTTHQWTISKRFSDLVQFHENICKLKLRKFLSEVKEDANSSPLGLKDFPPTFPSKFHLRGNHSPQLIEERRAALDAYFKGVLKYMQLLTLAAIGVKKSYSAPLRAGFGLLVDTLRASSQSEFSEPALWAKDDPYSPGQDSNDQKSSSPSSSPVRRSRGSPSFGGNYSPLTSSKAIFGSSDVQEQQPPCKIILEPNFRFTIVFYLPGVLLNEMYVDSTSERDRAVIIGGKWNQGILGLETLREQGVFHDTATVGSSPSEMTVRSPPNTASARSPPSKGVGGGGGGGNTGRRSTPSARRARDRVTLMDTLPRGSFELVFDVPPPFERAHWYSEYEGGVLLIMWDAPQHHAMA